MVGSDSKDSKWETYSKVIKGKEVSSLPEKSGSPSHKTRRQKRTLLLETSEGVECSLHEDSNAHSTEALCKSPSLSITKESPKAVCEEPKLEPENYSLDLPEKSPSSLIEEIHNKALEERIKMLPRFPLDAKESCHIHCEFCGHLTIFHGNHVDYLSDGELHFTSPSGFIYPHKLGVSSTNPIRCQLQDASNSCFYESPRSKEQLYNMSLTGTNLENEVSFYSLS